MSEHISGALNQLLPMFTSSSKWTLQSILQSHPTITQEFKVGRGFPSGWEIYCILPCSNSKYHFHITIGTNKKNLENLLPYEGDHALRLSALGEVAKVISGLLTADDLFLEAFEHMRPSTPFYSEGEFTDRSDWCAYGKIAVGGHEIFLNFSVRDRIETTQSDDVPSQPGEAEDHPPTTHSAKEKT